MPAFLANLGAAFAGNAIKWGLGFMLLLGAGGGGFVWGESHATEIAAAVVTHDADARVAAAQKSDSALLAGYLSKLSAQTSRGDALSAALAEDQNKFAAATEAAKENVAHAVSEILPAISLLPLSACSTPSPPAIEASPVPAALIRPACSPPAALMRAPAPLAALPPQLSQRAAVQTWLDDMGAYQALRDQAGALETFIRRSCQ